ncbi:glycyl-radical enzyme activating protein [Pontiella sulfatireligans]|uniref:4-hydroxyphenylacetate decarboxylase activating enzyme n=1 Tax=Pontiella sulfatireligans TaxID=2750658 RepID=A0A6C2UG34_9BACT|nr:glycyl-radical enzyme activating protein [Pontiella sulfatireligans]VGO19125.1 4-hydroxyphenylacetate decarboxylase activating enzyme [Pontiella sulfatireligans]
MSKQGHTFSVKRMQTHDGPGLRTTVFMKGCSLRCAWCHNPESLSGKAELWRNEPRCIGCGICALDDGSLTDHDNWNGDPAVIENCPAKALEPLRKDWSVEALLADLERDAAFFTKNGGITVSGGEPAMQWPFVAELLKGCREREWHTALDTCGAAPAEALDVLLPLCDLVLFDLKIMNSSNHRKWTGQGNEQILDNFCKTMAYATEHPELKIWIRTPLIPGATDGTENIEAIGHFLSNHWTDQIERWDLCAFNNLAVEKYQKMNMEWEFAETPLMERKHGEELLQTAIGALGPEKYDRVYLKGRMI